MEIISARIFLNVEINSVKNLMVLYCKTIYLTFILNHKVEKTLFIEYHS